MTQDKKRRNKKVLLVVGSTLLVIALCVASVLFGMQLYKRQINPVNVTNIYPIDIRTSFFTCKPAQIGVGYMLVGEQVDDNYFDQMSGGSINILPDILPEQYFVGYLSRSADIGYTLPGMEPWNHSYYISYYIRLYDLKTYDNTLENFATEPLEEINVIGLLAEQHPGLSLTNTSDSWDMANGYATYYNERPCVILRVYDPGKDDRKEYSPYDEKPYQLMALDLETKEIFLVEDDSLEVGRASTTEVTGGEANDTLKEQVGKSSNIPFSARINKFIEGGVVLRLEAINLDGYDAPILDMFPTLLEEAANMQWGSRMEIHLYDLTDDEVVELVTPR